MNILFVGKPGSGKGTLAQKLVERGYVQLSTGNLLREEQSKGTVLGNEIAKLLAEGKFASDEVVFKMVSEFINVNQGKSVLFDGYPRNLFQAESCFNGGLKFDCIFMIDVPDETVVDRIANRRIHPSSGRVYNVKTLPSKVEGKDDVTGEDLVQRDDDKAETVRKRLDEYNRLTAPILSFFSEKALPVTVIDGTLDLSVQVGQILAAIDVSSESSPTPKMKKP